MMDEAGSRKSDYKFKWRMQMKRARRLILAVNEGIVISHRDTIVHHYCHSKSSYHRSLAALRLPFVWL